MGYQSVMSIVQAIRGETVPKRISTGEYLATPENMKTPEIDKLLNPEQI
jgi:ribose transport system substrate-binding protein